jgi:hypothetical protein
MSELRFRRPAAGEHGFVLVGVVMFVLALTIMGLTLFDLSGYEAQFFERSVDEAQAYQVAMGGVEWVQWALGTDNDMRVVRNTPLPAGVTYARARYADNKDSTAAPIDWSGARAIEVRVLSQHHMARRMVEVRFTPRPPRDYWKRLMSLSGRLRVVPTFQYPSQPVVNRSNQVWLWGSMWQNDADTTWLSIINAASDVRHPIQLRAPLAPVPPLDLTAFFAQHWASATEVPPLPASNNRYDLDDGNPAEVHFYRTTYNAANGWEWSIRNDIATDKPTVRIRGRVVWMLERGAFFAQPLRVSGHENATLTIVAGPSLDPTKPALQFFGGLESAERPLFLASSADVSIFLYNVSTKPAGYDEYALIQRLSIVARDVELMGPEPAGGGMMRLFHDPASNSDLNRAGGVIDQLYADGALPIPTGGVLRGTLTPMAGTWREVTESTPD